MVNDAIEVLVRAAHIQDWVEAQQRPEGPEGPERATVVLSQLGKARDQAMSTSHRLQQQGQCVSTKTLGCQELCGRCKRSPGGHLYWTLHFISSWPTFADFLLG